MTFEAIDTEAQPAAMQELARFGITRVPAVTVGDRAVHGWNPKGVADLVGVPYENKIQLPLPELARRLDRILSAAQRAVRQIPATHLDMKTPGRDRSVRYLSYHIFRVGLSFRDTTESGYLPEATFAEKPPAEMRDGEAIACYGEHVRERLTDWLQRPGIYEGSVDTYYGPQTTPEFFERTVWHTAQHLRQLYALLDTWGIAAHEPLPPGDFAGLPLPSTVW